MSLTVGRRQFFEQLGRSGSALAAGDAPAAGPRMAFKLPPRSYTVAHLATG